MSEAAVAEETQGATSSTASGETELFKQSYSISIPKTAEGLEAVFTDEQGNYNLKAHLYTVRAGLKQILNNRLRQLATAKDKDGNPTFQPTDGVYDATPLILQAPQRQILSQREKLEKNLKSCNMPDAVIQQMLTTFDANVGTEQDTAGDTAVDTSEFVVVLGGKEGKQLIMRVPRASDEDEE